jgi:hypothetical protein
MVYNPTIGPGAGYISVPFSPSPRMFWGRFFRGIRYQSEERDTKKKKKTIIVNEKKRKWTKC